MILVPVNGWLDPDGMRVMMTESSAMQVSPEEVLSDSIYIYLRDADGITVA